MNTSTKKDLAAAVHQANRSDPRVRGVTRQSTERIVARTLDAMADAIGQGHDLTFVGYMSSNVHTTPARRAVNPNTGQRMIVPERQVLRLKPGKRFVEAAEQSRAGTSHEHY